MARNSVNPFFGTHSETHVHQPSLKLAENGFAILQWGFILAAGGMLYYYAQSDGPVRDTLAEMFTIFVSIVLEALPFMLLGSLAGGVIEVFVPQEKLSSLLAQRKLSAVLIAAGMGLVFPVCECAIIPVVRRLLRKGIPFSAAVAYLLAGPLVNPIVAVSTAVAYMGEWRMVLLRLGFGYAIATGVGLWMSWFFEGKAVLRGEEGHGEHVHQQGSSCNCEDHLNLSHEHAEGNTQPITFWGRVLAAMGHASDDFLDVARFLVIGAFLAGVLRGLITESSIVGLMVGHPFVSIPLMMVVAMLLNLCSEADAFVAASFRNLIPLPGQMAFMVLGPMLDLKLLLMYSGVFQKKVILVLASTTFTAVLLGMIGLGSFTR